MLFFSAWVAFDPDEIGTRSRTVSGVVVMRASSLTGGGGGDPGGYRVAADRAAAPAPGRVGDVASQHRGDVGLEQFEAGPVLRGGEPAGVGVQVQDRVAELLVVAVYLLDHLGRAADQGRRALDEVLQRAEHRWHAQPLLEGEVAGEDRAVGVDRVLGVAQRVVAGRARADRDRG